MNMKNLFSTIFFASKTVLANKNYISLFLVLFFVFFALFVFIPIWIVPGNTLATQLDIFTPRDYAVLVFLSSFSSLFIAMQIYAMRERKEMAGASTTVGGGFGALLAGIAGTASCASCLAPLFAFFGIGFGGVIFVLEYRFYFVAGTTLFMLIAIYLTARKINKVCNSC